MDDDPLSVVSAYLAARDAFDFEAARRLLSDVGFVYRSPITRFDSADDCMAYFALAAGIVRRVTTRKVFVDGEDVCHFQTLVVQISEKISVEVAHWARVREGKIVQIEAVFDASAYRELFPAEP